MKLKLPSFQEITSSTRNTVIRFPMAIIYSVIITLYGIFLTHNNFSDNRYYYLLHVLSLGIIISIGVSIFSEIKKLASLKKILLNVGVAALLTGYFLLFKDNFSAKIIYRILIITFSLIILVLALPFFTKNHQLDYWKFNFQIFNRFVLAAFFSGVIYFGLSIALLVIDLLFNTAIDGKIYFDIWILIVGIFAVFNFLSGYPYEFYTPNEEFEYPKSLRIFVQFILIPLTTIYLAILYAYIFKILLNWSMPQGSVSWLVLSFSALGLLSLIIIFPIKNDDNYKWINTFGKYFFYAILPLIVLLFISIITRINNYGFTENRYFIAIFAIWLTVIAIISIINKFSNIKIVFISFSFMFLFASFGPWSSFNIAKISQVKHLQNILSENDIFVNGKLHTDSVTVSDSIYDEILDISEYLIENHGFKIIETNFDIIIDTSSSTYSRTLAYSFMNQLDLTINNACNTNYSDDNYFDFSSELNTIDLGNYNKLYKIHNLYDYERLDIENLTLYINNNNLVIKIDNDSTSFDIHKYVVDLYTRYDYYHALDSTESSLNFNINNHDVVLLIDNISGNINGSSIFSLNLSGQILY